MHPTKLVLLMFALSTALLTAQGRKTLDIYSIDVEGGGATLFVSPSGQSLLVDSGNPSNGRDADRIVAAAKDAGVTQIDYLVTTHFHGDHIGGLSELASRFPIRHYVDHHLYDPRSGGSVAGALLVARWSGVRGTRCLHL
jgi:beta-lactamase superfamily II metal-dependent hydrolase